MCIYLGRKRLVILSSVHLVTVWLNRGAQKMDGGQNNVYSHLFGKSYFLETLKESLEGVSQVFPVSLASIPDPLERGTLTTLETKASAGRPSTKRRASNMDNFRTGAKRKVPKSLPATSDKENSEGNHNYVDDQDYPL